MKNNTNLRFAFASILQALYSLALGFFFLSCNIQGKGTKLGSDFRPGYTPEANIESSTTPTSTSPTPTPTPSASSLKAPVLSALSNRVMPSTYIDVDSSVSLDVNDSANTPESVNTYTCTFDRAVDGVVTSTTACSTLPGTVTTTSLTSSGAIAWIPNSTAYGPYELKFTATNSAGTASSVVVVQVRQSFSLTNLISYWDAQFAFTTANASNSSSTATSWSGLLASYPSDTGTLSGFTLDSSSGWGGSASQATSSSSDGPYRLIFDGTDNLVDFTSSMATQTDATLEAWIRPSSSASTGTFILGNADAANNFGMAIRQSAGTPGSLQLVAGNGTLICESTQVLSDNIWYHVAGVFDGTADSVTLYINGTRECTATSGGQTLEGSTYGLRAGADTLGANFWAGAIAEIRLYSVALGHGTIKGNVAATWPRFPTVASTVSSSTMSLWLDASQGTSTSGSLVTGWSDQSGNGNNATAVPGKEPTLVSSGINSRPVLRFSSSGSGSVMKISDSASLRPSSITIFAVFQRQVASMSGAKIIARPFDTAETGGAPYFSWALGTRFGATDSFEFDVYTATAISDAETTATYSDATSYLFQSTYNSGTTTMSAFVNGAVSAFNALTTAPTTAIDYTEVGQNIWIGDSPVGGGSTQLFDGDLAEIMIFPGVLATDERQRVESYLNAKYALYQ